jgi:hypothetical protein
MSLPTLKVEIAFVSAPLSTSPTWVDVTEYVRHSPGVSISRGRQSSTGTFSPGSCTFSLDNRDRRFDPQYASSPYNGYLTPRRQVRVSATWPAADILAGAELWLDAGLDVAPPVVIFRGHITGWPTAYPFVGTDSTVDIEAYDGLAWLAETIIPDPVLAYANTVGLTAFYRNVDPGEWVDVLGGVSALLAGGAAVLGPSLSAGVSSPSVVFAPPTRWVSEFRLFSTFADFSVSFWIKTTGSGASSTNWMSLLASDRLNRYEQRIGIDDTGVVRFEGYNTSFPGFRPAVSSSIPVNDGVAHHVVVLNDNNTPRCYVDGVDVSTGVAQGTSTFSSRRFGAPADTTSDTSLTGEMSDVSFYTRALTPTEVATLYGLSFGSSVESTGARLTRILDAVGWPAAWRDQTITSGLRGECAEVALEGRSASAAAQQVADTEQGGLYCTPSNDVCLFSRYHAQEAPTGTTSQTTFSDDGTGIPYTAFAGFTTRDNEMVNDATVSSVWGPRQASNATSITDYGRQSTNVRTLLSTVALAADMANGIVAARKDPQIRSGAFSVALGVLTAAQQATVLGLDCGERITMEITPSGVGSQIVKPLILDRIDHDITADEWTVSLAGSPVPFAFFMLDSSALDTGVLGF